MKKLSILRGRKTLHPEYDNGCDDNNPYALNLIAPNRVYLNQSRLNLTVTYKKNKFVTENRLSYDNIRKGHQKQTGIA